MSKSKGLILVIVESPGKISKIQHILGDDYLVMASVGHIMDLDKSKFSIDVENNFALTYKILEGKEQVVKKIKSAYFDCADVLIATDKDREGEAIGDNLATVLKISKPKRITFTSITKDDLLKAVKNPGSIDVNMVDAQKLRRVFDRMIGYKLSPLLWKSMGSGQLSAGRVQSVVVKLIIEKEKEIENFFSQKSSSYFKLNGEFKNSKNNIFKSQLYTTKDQKIIDDDDENLKLCIADDNDSDDDNNKSNSSKKSKMKKNDSDESDFSEDEKQKKSTKLTKSKKLKKDTKTKKKTKNNNNKSDDDFNEESEGEGELKLNKKGQIAKIESEEETEDIMKKITKSEFTIVDTVKREKISQPSAPFTTSTLQQEAANKFGFGAKRTMQAAQHLYEGGYITYMRTDSTNLSEEALKTIGEFIVKKYGKEYHREKKYVQKKQNTQEAHEAVRPTDPKVLGVNPDTKHKIASDEIKLYTLIWKRAVASQMSPAKFDVYATEINISKLEDYYFVNQIENNIFPGFLAVYNLANDKNEVDEEKAENNTNIDKTESKEIISKIDVPKIGTKLTAKSVVATQDYKKPPTRYSEASLVGKLGPKQLNIGRPATTPTIIEKIQTAGYVKKEDITGEERTVLILSWNGDSKSKIEEKKTKIFLGKEKNKFVPTSVGNLINEFLEKHFSEIIDYKFTAEMEKELDNVAMGKIEWTKVADKFWKKFYPLVENLNKTIKPKEMADANAKELGIHPENGNKIIATIARYGPVVKMIDKDNPNSVSYGPIKKPLTLEKITLADAVKILSYPKNLGRYKGKIVGLYKGAYGYYLKIGTESVALKNTDEDIDKLTLESAIKAIETKSESQLWKGSDAKNMYVVKDGEYGKYINCKPLIVPKSSKNKNGINVKLPEDVELDKLTTEKASEIINNYFEKKKQRGIKKDGKDKKDEKNKKEIKEIKKESEEKKTKKETKKETKK